MLRTPQSTTMFQASHLTVAGAVDRGHRRAARVTKRTSIWAGGLSTAGGKLPG